MSVLTEQRSTEKGSILRDFWAAGLHNAGVRVEDYLVTLTGRVTSHDEGAKAERIAKNHTTKTVANHLKVG